MKRSAFTLIELLVVISIIALLIAILLPALGAARRTASKMQNSVSLRSLHQAQVMYGEENKSYYTGLNSKGQVRTNADLNSEFGFAAMFGGTQGDHVVARFAILALGDFVAYEHLISAVDPDRLVWDGTSLFSHQYMSYAALDISVASSPARGSWRNDLSSLTPIFSDRSTWNSGPTTIGSSLWNIEKWEGGLVWNDGHTTYEGSADVGATELMGQNVAEDNLIDGTTSYDGIAHGSHVRMIKLDSTYTNGSYPGGFNP